MSATATIPPPPFSVERFVRRHRNVRWFLKLMVAGALVVSLAALVFLARAQGYNDFLGYEGTSVGFQVYSFGGGKVQVRLIHSRRAWWRASGWATRSRPVAAFTPAPPPTHEGLGFAFYAEAAGKYDLRPFAMVYVIVPEWPFILLGTIFPLFVVQWVLRRVGKKSGSAEEDDAREIARR